MLSWPSGLPLPFAGGYAPFVRSLSGGQSLSGIEQVQPQLHDRWQAAFSFHLGTDARVLAMRALLASLRGRSNSIALPVFDNNRAPLSADVPGSPIGSAVVNPAFARAAVSQEMANGATVLNPPFTRDAVTLGSPIGDEITAPAFWRRFPELAGTDYEFDDGSGVAGNVTVAADDRVLLALTSGATAPSAGIYVTLDGARRLIVDVILDDDVYDLRFTPHLDVADSSEAFAAASVTGTATITAADRFSFAATAGAPQRGDRVTLNAVVRELIAVDGAGPYVCQFTPGLTSSSSYGSVAVTGTATIAAADRFSFAPSAGVPMLGDHVTLSAATRTLVNVSGSGPYQCTFSPPLSVAATTPGSVVAVLNANAAINATSVDVHVTTGVAPTPGHLFSLGTARLYTIDSVSALGGAVYRCEIWPWLRAAASGGDAVNFSTPACEMRLASDAEGAEALRALRLGKWGDVTLRFDEAAPT